MSDEPKPEILSRNVLLILLIISLAALLAVVFLVVRSGKKEPEKIITLMETTNAAKAGINILQVVDTLTDKTAVAVEGHRYKVLIADEAREGSSGIARIGGLVTFVPDTRKGDVVVVEITRMKQSTADAIVIERIESGHTLPVAESSEYQPSDKTHAPSGLPVSSAMVGQIFRGTVSDTGREGDGVVRVDNKVVFVKGASLGEHVEFKITEDAGRFARADVVSKSEVPFETTPVASEAPKPAKKLRTVPDFDKPVNIGEEHVVTITENDRRNPEVDGVTRIDNFVIFVPGTKIGDKVRIRIKDMSKRAADAEVIERIAPETTAP